MAATGATVKMSVDVTQFKKGIQEATASVKTLDAQLEVNEKQLKLNGDAEIYMKNKAALLKTQLDEQRQVVVNTHKALEAMRKNGVDPASQEFQKMERNLAQAQGKMITIQTELKNVETDAGGAKKETKGMNDELKNIGKGVAFENITNGLKEITTKLENGARAAVNFGKKIARSAMDSTEWADDVLTRATQYGVDAETIQRMDNVAKYIDTDVDTIIAARGRLAKNAGSIEEYFGIEPGDNIEDTFWEIGEAIMAMGDEWEQEEAAQKIFGGGWKELLPLFTAGRQEYEQLMAEQNVLTNEQVKKLGEADDQIQKIKQEAELLKNQFWADNSQTIINLLQWLVDHKDAVVTALTVIGGGFAALKVGEFALNLGKVINGFNTLIGMGGGGDAAAETAAEALGGQFTKAAATGGAAKVGLTATVKAAIAAALPAAVGTVVGMGALGGIAYAAASNNYTYRGTYDPTRYSGREDRQYIQAAIRGIIGSSSDNGKWQFGHLAATAKNAEEFLGLFDYTDTSGAKQNWLLSELGAGDQMRQAAIYETMRLAYGRDFTRNMSAEQQALFGYGQEAYQALGNVDYTSLLAGARSFFGNNGVFNENGEWTIPGLAESTDAQTNAATAITNAAQVMESLPQETADAVSQAMRTTGISFGSILSGMFGRHANGLYSVPWNGYMALLDRDERVLTAREARTYNANSNLYVENMNMNNGMDAAALAAAMNAQNQRIRAGFGS